MPSRAGSGTPRTNPTLSSLGGVSPRVVFRPGSPWLTAPVDDPNDERRFGCTVVRPDALPR